MTHIKKILFPVDLTVHSAHVAKYAAALAKDLKAELLVLYVAPAFNEYAGFQTPMASLLTFAEQLTKEAEIKLNEYLKVHFYDAQASYRVLMGYPSDEIINLAEKEKFDLIIMGTNGRTGLNHFIFGSVAEKVIKTSPVPVMTVRPA